VARGGPAAPPVLGVGLGYREPYRADVFLHRGRIGFLEIVADHYLDPTPEKERELELLAAHFTLVPHALDLSVASAEGVDADYLRRLARLVNSLDPPWWSDHVAFTRAGGVSVGHLTPTVFSAEAAAALARNVEEVRARIDAPLLLENITYSLTLPGAEMGEAEFLCEVLERTGCGLLLDVTNLYTNSVNHGYDPREFLRSLPPERVVQVHFAGGHWHHGSLVDSHSRPTPEEVWRLFDETLRLAPVKGASLERDEDLPPFPEILGELERARAAGRAHGRWD